MKKIEWGQLPTPVRVALAAVAGVDAGLRLWSLVDLARRPDEQVRGPKVAWMGGLIAMNTVGALPAAYLLWGRHAAATDR